VARTSWQGPQERLLVGEAGPAREITAAHEALEEVAIGRARREVARGPDAQGLVDRLLEAMVGLLDVTVLVRHPGVVRRRDHPVMREQRGIAGGRLGPAGRVQRPDRRAEVVGAMLLRHPAELPPRGLQPLRQGLEALRAADPHRLRIGVGQHEMEDEMREGHAGDGDRQVGHVGEVRLGTLPRPMHLRENHLLRRPVPGPPCRDVALEGPQLDRLVAAGAALAQQREERRRLQGGIGRQLLTDPRPLLGEGIGAGDMRPRRPQLAGESARPLVFADGADTHPGPRRRLLLRFAFCSLLNHASYLRVGLHGPPLRRPCYSRHAVVPSSGNPGDRHRQV